MSTQQPPFVIVIMAVRNEATFIERSLGAVLQQDYPTDRMEVIVADGMSDDGTREILAQYAATTPHLRLIDNPNKIVSTALNRAIAEARGEIIVRVDGHTIIEPNYVRECVAALQRTGADNVGGRMQAIGSGALAEAIALATSSPFGVGGARFHYSERKEWVDTVYMGAWPRRVFDAIGGFDKEMVPNQDEEFNYRLRGQGGRILLVPSIKSFYYCRNSLKALSWQYWQYGYGKVRVTQKHPRQMRLRQFVPAAFVSTLARSLLAGGFTAIGWMPFGGFLVHTSSAILQPRRLQQKSAGTCFRSRLRDAAAFVWTRVHGWTGSLCGQVGSAGEGAAHRVDCPT